MRRFDPFIRDLHLYKVAVSTDYVLLAGTRAGHLNLL
jgi:hypothetical protein